MEITVAARGKCFLAVGILLLCVAELPSLLPHLAGVEIVSVDAAGPVVTVQARTRDEPARCTGCGVTSDWVHSRYVRRPADRAIGGRPARIELSVRRLYCENPVCPKVTFAEQVDRLTVRYQRRPPLLQHLVETAGVLLAGRGGARLLELLNAPLSRTSVLFQLMRVPCRPPGRLGYWASTTSRCTATRTAPCSSTVTPGCRSPCGRDAAQAPQATNPLHSLVTPPGHPLAPRPQDRTLPRVHPREHPPGTTRPVVPDLLDGCGLPVPASLAEVPAHGRDPARPSRRRHERPTGSRVSRLPARHQLADHPGPPAGRRQL
ncbi:transposase family protein [Streptomyces sp. NPDC056682]|uniref:transposase family protein n=1 Tax=Streptomyces sp. NPDC056682 TaxID=3345909 RepID=UPI0036CF926C